MPTDYMLDEYRTKGYPGSPLEMLLRQANNVPMLTTQQPTRAFGVPEAGSPLARLLEEIGRRK